MKPLRVLLPLSLFIQLCTAAEPPEKALEYHEILLKQPSNETLFDRFFEAWIDEQDIASLEAFLTTRAEQNGGTDLPVLARYQLRRGNEEAALATLGKAITALPLDFSLPMERAHILLRRLDFAAARKDLETAAASPDATIAIEAGTLIGKSHLREGNPTAAEVAWEKLIAKHPANTEILEDLVELTATSDQADQAIDYSRRLIAATTGDFRKAQHQLRLGELLADSGKSEEALAIWSETLTQTGEGSWLEKEIIARITTSFRRLDRIDALSAKLSELAAANPRRFLIQRELAKLDAAEGKLDAAIDRYREILRRSPDETEFREEFIRLLIDGQRFGDAAAELVKMIALSPKDSELNLRMADLINRRAEADPNRNPVFPPPAEILPTLEKALAVSPPDEPSGIRIAGLMLTYGLTAQGEKLLSSLAAAPNASPAPAEALAAGFARTGRKKKAIALLTQIAKSPDADTVLRATSAISSLGESKASFAILSARLTDFPNQPAYLTALSQVSLAAKKSAEAITPALRLVRLATTPREILDTTRIATSVIAASEKTDAEIAALTARNDRTPSETCLLAALLETKPDPSATDALFKAATDPALLRFHATLLSRRGDPLAAIAALRSLNQGNSNPDILKELSELQLQAGLAADCLKTLDEWKTAAPTAREPWIIAARMLRESGRQAEAIETTRRALTRFPGDVDFTASLAGLHQHSGDYAEAERIFWKLYDQAQNSAAKSRWAERLATLAQLTGGTDELAEKFIARARRNPRSTGPLLALVEIARSTGDRESVRDHLARALFIKPGDIDIRIQLADAEAQAGNTQAQIAVLSEGISKDPEGRLRTALAQAHIEGGEAMKGMGILRALAGERASDPRVSESVAASLHTKYHVSEAIQYLREALPDGGDWRTKYLLALMLREDGRELEAIPVFLSLLSEEKEIASLTQNPNTGHNHHLTLRNIPHSVARAEISYLSHAAEAAGRNTGRRSEPISQFLPVTTAQLRAYSLIELAGMASSGNEKAAEAITATRPPALAFAIDLIAAYQTGQRVDFLTLLEKHPNHLGLFEFVWLAGSFDENCETPIPLLKRILATTKPSAAIRFTILTTLTRLEPDEPGHWDQLLAVAAAALRSDDTDFAFTVARQFSHTFSTKPKNISPERITRIKDLLTAYLTDSQAKPDPHGMRLYMIALVGTRDQWIAAVNNTIAEYRAAPQPVTRPAPVQYRQRRSREPDLSLPNPTYLPFSSIPSSLAHHMASSQTQDPENGDPITAAGLLPHLDRIDSPLLRAYIAIQSGDEKAINKTLSAPHPDIEATDFEILRASREISAGRNVEAFRLYVKLRESPDANTMFADTANSTLIAIAKNLTPEQRTEFEQPLRAALAALTPPPGPYRDATGIIELARRFGFEDIVKSLTPKPPASSATHGSPTARIGLAASITPPSPHRQPEATSTPIDRSREFASEGKNFAAAREFVNWVESMKSYGYGTSNITREAGEFMTPSIKAAVLALTDPGTEHSLTKRRAHIDLCIDLGERGKALTALSALAAERPFDLSVTCDLAFLLPPEKNERAIGLLSKAAGTPYFRTAINTASNRISETTEKATVLAFIARLAGFLETSPPETCDAESLSQISNVAVDAFLSNIFPDNLPLVKQEETGDNRPAPDANHIATVRRLALAMLRHPTLADTGFSLLNSATWEEKPADLDEWARSAILLTASYAGKIPYDNIASNPYPEKSPVKYLLARLAIPAPNLLPAAYVEKLSEQDPHLPELLRFHTTPTTPESIATLWDSGAMKLSASYSVQTLQQATYPRAAAAPGASRFFLSRIKKITPEEAATLINGGDAYLARLIRAAFTTCSFLDEKGVNETCSTIIAILFPKDQPDPQNERHRRATGTLQSILNNFTTDPLTAARIVGAFDLTFTPLDTDWLRSNLQPLSNQPPAKAIKTLTAMGLLADAASWKPLAATIADYNDSSNQPALTLTRKDQTEIIVQNTDSDIRKKIAGLLESRKPRTFGALITAACYAEGSERERLATAAFKLAAPALNEANARRLDDFALLLPLLPYTATASLPPKLREIALKNRADAIDALIKTAEHRIAEAVAGSQDPLQSISHEEICKLADFDHTKATGVFLKAAALSLEPANAVARSETRHEDVLNNILRSINPEAALRFHQAVLASPIGPRFGISGTSDQKTFLSTIGESIETKTDRGTGEAVYRSEEPWLTATRMHPEIRMDALAALACDYLQRLSPTDKDQSLKTFTGSTHPDIRSFAVAVISMTSWNYDEPKVRNATSQAFLGLLAHPDLNTNARTQIALTAASSYPAILRDPAIAEAVANIFTVHCERDASVVSNIPLLIVHSIGTETIPPAALPHLKRINGAFWKNANAPITGGHPPIPEFYTLPLFQTAVAVGDSETVKRLFPTVQPSLSGKLTSILSMISAGHFDFAAALLPDDNTHFDRDGFYYNYTPEFHRQIIAFRESGVNSSRLLRLECALLEMPDTKGRRQSSELTEQSRKDNIAAYAKNPPVTPITKLEILHALATSTDPASDILSAELIKLADTLNPTAIMNDWANATSSPENLLADSKWDILCKAAANNFASGDAKPFITLLKAITKYPKVAEDRKNPTESAMYGIFPYILPATCTAIANGKTGGFSGVIEPLGTVAKSLPNDNHALIVETLALCEFLAYWEGNPAAFARILGQINGDASKNIKGKFSFPRNRPPFLDALARYNQDKRPSLPVPMPEGFPLALFSHAPISDLLPSMEKTWLGEFSRSNLKASTEKLALEEFPESITPAARAILLIHRANHFRNIGRRDEVHAQYRASLAVMPPGKPWDHVRTHTKCHVIWEMLEKGKVQEARELFDSIKPHEISRGSESFYERLLKDLKTKEHRQVK